MMKMSFPILLATALGCAADVELPLDLGRGPDEPEPPPADEWSRADFPAQGWVQQLAWTTDGAVVAASPEVRSPTESWAWTLTRLGAAGAIEWKAHPTLPDIFTNLAAIEDGGVVVAVRPDLYQSSSARPVGLAWYDADGTSTAEWRPADDVTGTHLASIGSIRPLPDGSVFWAGLAGEDLGPVAGLVDAERQLRWIVPLPTPAGREATDLIEVARTADGGLVALIRYEPEDLDAPSSAVSAYVVELGPDGGERWRTEIMGSLGTGLRVGRSGNLVVTGTFSGRVSVGDDVLEVERYPPRHFVAEIEPAGELRGLHLMELPGWLVGPESRFRIDAMAVRGDDLVVAGPYFADTTPLTLAGFLSTNHRIDGTLVSERIFALQEVAGNGSGTGPMAVDIASDGRVAAGGAFSGSVDFGDGVVDGGENEQGFSLAKPFVTVFDPGGDEVD